MLLGKRVMSRLFTGNKVSKGANKFGSLEKLAADN